MEPTEQTTQEKPTEESQPVAEVQTTEQPAEIVEQPAEVKAEIKKANVYDLIYNQYQRFINCTITNIWINQSGEPKNTPPY